MHCVSDCFRNEPTNLSLALNGVRTANLTYIYFRFEGPEMHVCGTVKRGTQMADPIDNHSRYPSLMLSNANDTSQQKQKSLSSKLQTNRLSLELYAT